MLALISLKGGIPVYSLKEIPGFSLPKRKFESIQIPFNKWEEEKDFVETNSGVLYAMTNYKRIRGGSMKKEELLACYWDYIIGPCMIEGSKNLEAKIESNYNLKEFLGTYFDVFSDWVLIIKSLKIPVLFIEILQDFSTKEHYEKGLVKIYLQMMESCKRLAKDFIERGFDPRCIRVFGLLIWRSEIQFCIAHPSIVLRNKNSNEIEEISVNISGHGNKEWQVDTLQYKPAFYFDVDYEKLIKMTRKALKDRIICKQSLCKLKLFFKACFNELERLTNILGITSLKVYKFAKEPADSENRKVTAMSLDVYNSIPNSFKLFFPLMQKDGRCCEKMEEIRKNVCKTSLKQHLIEACTFAIHLLFELLILHEKAGYVHCNINCENIKFSSLLKIWKLCNFEYACKIEKSKKIMRIVGTSGFISPESNSSGIFTESSDVFALGKVLSRVFYIEMAYELELRIADESEIKMIDEFFEIVCKMCKKDVKERISVRASMKEFYLILKRNEIEGFFVYGTNLIFPLIEKELK